MPSLVAPPLSLSHLGASNPLEDLYLSLSHLGASNPLEDLYKNYFTPTTHPHTTSLPNEYIWPEQYRPLLLPDDTESLPNEIPIVDMEGDAHTLGSKLAHACEHWGVFYVTNHGVPLDLLERVTEKGLKLFSLPLSTKMQVLRKEGSFEGFGKAMIGKFFSSLMWSEGFTMMGHPTSSIADTTNKIFPSGHNEFREAFEEYDKAVRGVGGSLMRAILEGLGVEMEKFTKRQYDVEREGQGALQLNYYAPCPQPLMTMGLPAHTDSTCLTLLHQGLVPGLQMLRHDGRWTLVPPLCPSSLVVLVGDMLQVLSNGRYKSIVHRAIANKRNPRLSIVCLCFPPSNATIVPPREVVDASESQRPLYKPFNWRDYLQAKSEYFMDALDHFKDD